MSKVLGFRVHACPMMGKDDWTIRSADDKRCSLCGADLEKEQLQARVKELEEALEFIANGNVPVDEETQLVRRDVARAALAGRSEKAEGREG